MQKQLTRILLSSVAVLAVTMHLGIVDVRAAEDGAGEDKAAQETPKEKSNEEPKEEEENPLKANGSEDASAVTEIDGIKYKLLRTTSAYEQLPDGEFQPWRVLRKLQKLQDEIAAGTPFAQDAYAEFLQKSAIGMSKLDDSVWNFERNLDAAAVFLMFGGATEIGFKALKRTKLGLSQKVFLEAALSFVERDVSRANALMQLIDHTALPYSMSAQLALAKSMTLSSSNLKEAKKYLMEARRLGAGTLVEEAAIRRLIRIAGEMKSFEDLKPLYKTYLLRFSKSYYFNDYVRNVGFAAVRMPKEKEESVLELLNYLTEFMDHRQNASIAVYVARYAAISGRSKLSQWAEKQTEGKLRPNSKLHTRMQLYAAASKVVQHEKTAETMLETSNFNSDILDPSDLKILNAVNMIGTRILTSEKEILAEHEAKKSAPDRTDKEILAEKARETMIQNEVGNHAILSKADMLFAEMEQLMPESVE